MPNPRFRDLRLGVASVALGLGLIAGALIEACRPGGSEYWRYTARANSAAGEWFRDWIAGKPE